MKKDPALRNAVGLAKLRLARRGWLHRQQGGSFGNIDVGDAQSTLSTERLVGAALFETLITDNSNGIFPAYRCRGREEANRALS